MLLDENKILDLTKKEPGKTAPMIKDFFAKHKKRGGDIAFYTGRNSLIIQNIMREAQKGKYLVNQDYMYSRGCVIVELGVKF